MRLSDAGANLIESFEGFRSAPYRDAVGVWTIGFGTTHGVGPGTAPISRQEAHQRLMREIDAEYGAAINSLRLPLSQSQFDALVSFVYNVGPGGVASTTGIGRELRRHDWRAAADELLRWDKAGGRPLLGLTRRRQAERALFLASPPDPLAGHTDSERRWIREYDRLKRHAREPVARVRMKELIDAMTLQRKRIWRAAQPQRKGGDGHGWDHAHRHERYHSLVARTIA